MKEYPALDNTELLNLLKEDNEGAFTEIYNRLGKLTADIVYKNSITVKELRAARLYRVNCGC